MFKQLKEEGFDVFMMSFSFSVVKPFFSINDDANKINTRDVGIGECSRGMIN